MAGWKIVSGDTFANIHKNSGVWTYGESLCGAVPNDCEPYVIYSVKAEIEDGDDIRFPHFCSDDPSYVNTYCGKIAQVRENISCNEEMLVMWFNHGDNLSASTVLTSNNDIFDIKNVDDCEHIIYSNSKKMIRVGWQKFEKNNYYDSGYPAIDVNPYDNTFIRKYSGETNGHKIKYHTTRDTVPSNTLVNCPELVELYFPHLYDESEEAKYIGKNIVRIDDGAFSGCTNLSAITFSAVKEIGKNAFYGCSGLKNIDWGHWACDSGQTGVTYDIGKPTRVIERISGSAFYDCNSLEILNLSGLPITYIGESAFENCYNLKTLTLPTNQNYTVVNSKVFFNCQSLSGMTIPSNIKRIENSAFQVDANHTKTTSGGEIVLSRNVTTVGSNAFNGYNMTKLIISAQTIGDNAFSNNTNLTSVTISSNISDIGNSAFSNCSPSIEIKFEGNNAPTIHDCDVFPNSANIKVISEQAKTAFKNGWSSFSSCGWYNNIQVIS